MKSRSVVASVASEKRTWAVLAALALAALGAVGFTLLGPMIWPANTTPGQPSANPSASAQAPGILIVAHRGDVDRFPEDTAEAIWAAAELEVDGIEMDVHRSADGTWWVIHDATLDRTTDRSGAIAELSDTQIERAVINGGHGFRAADHVGLRVPRLTTVLDGLAEFQGRIYLDVKHATGGDATELVALAGGHHLSILCRDEEEAAAIEALDPTVETVLTWAEGLETSAADAWLMEAVRQATPQNVQAAGLPVIVWVNERYVEDGEAAVLDGARSAGVSAFLTKHPAPALATRAAL